MPIIGFRFHPFGYSRGMDLVLWILAVILVVAGILALFRRQIIWGIVLIIVGLLVGPGGVSIFH
jgi:divalent metal cation (Fe/Co/Zn/Cd) transporter